MSWETQGNGWFWAGRSSWFLEQRLETAPGRLLWGNADIPPRSGMIWKYCPVFAAEWRHLLRSSLGGLAGQPNLSRVRGGEAVTWILVSLFSFAAGWVGDSYCWTSRWVLPRSPSRSRIQENGLWCLPDTLGKELCSLDQEPRATQAWCFTSGNGVCLQEGFTLFVASGGKTVGCTSVGPHHVSLWSQPPRGFNAEALALGLTKCRFWWAVFRVCGFPCKYPQVEATGSFSFGKSKHLFGVLTAGWHHRLDGHEFE